jgi:hypothetical protein
VQAALGDLVDVQIEPFAGADAGASAALNRPLRPGILLLQAYPDRPRTTPIDQL